MRKTMLLDELNNIDIGDWMSGWELNESTQEFFAVCQALNTEYNISNEVKIYANKNIRQLIQDIWDGKFTSGYTRNDSKSVADEYDVSEQFAEKIISICSIVNGGGLSTYTACMRKIYEVYTKYKDGRCTIKDIEEVLDNIVKEFRYVKYSIQDFKIDITLGIDEYSLYTMSGYSKYKRHVVYKDAADALLIKTLSKYSFLCNQDVISIRDNAELFLQYAEIEASSIKLDHDVEEEVVVNAVVAFTDILRENGKVNQLLKEQAIIKMALYKDIIDCIEENYIKCENDEDSRIVSLSRGYINKLKEDKEFEIFNVEAKG